MTIAVRSCPRALARRRRASSLETPDAAATIRSARSRSFAEPARSSTIHGPNTLPADTNAEVVIWFRASFVAVPAFNRVEPATTSGPTSSRTTTWASPRISRDRLAVTRMVAVPRRRASSIAPRTKGVTEEAETPITRSAGRTPSVLRAPSSNRSSAPSFARKTAERPPAMTATTLRGSVPKVGGSSAASSTASLPLVPAPKRKHLPPPR